MAKAIKKVALSEVKDDLSKYLRMAENEEILITRHGKPAGVLVGFGSDDAWFEYQLENDPRFLQRIERARQSLRNGKGVKLEDLPDSKTAPNKNMKRIGGLGSPDQRRLWGKRGNSSCLGQPGICTNPLCGSHLGQNLVDNARRAAVDESLLATVRVED